MSNTIAKKWIGATGIGEERKRNVSFTTENILGDIF